MAHNEAAPKHSLMRLLDMPQAFLGFALWRAWVSLTYAHPSVPMPVSGTASQFAYEVVLAGSANVIALLSSRIDWSVYFEYVFDCLVNGETIAKDWTAGMKDGAVVVTELNEAFAAEGTAEKIAEVEAGLADGSIKVFDTSTFTVDGETLTSAFALDTDGDFTPDSEEAVFDGAFHESYFQSAPYFAIKIDGIEWLNSAF